MSDRLIIDASTREERRESLTAEEEAERRARAEQAEQDRQQAEQEESTRTTLEDRATAALQANREWLQREGAPTNAQTVRHIDLLTRECSALIRLLLRRLDADD